MRYSFPFAAWFRNQHSPINVNSRSRHLLWWPATFMVRTECMSISFHLKMRWKSAMSSGMIPGRPFLILKIKTSTCWSLWVKYLGGLADLQKTGLVTCLNFYWRTWVELEWRSSHSNHEMTRVFVSALQLYQQHHATWKEGIDLVNPQPVGKLSDNISRG